MVTGRIRSLLTRPPLCPRPIFSTPLQLDHLVNNGKIYLSLGDAVLLALQNNYDIAIQRLNLDIADTDILRARVRAAGILGVHSSVLTGTQGGTTASVSAVGGGPGGERFGFQRCRHRPWRSRRSPPTAPVPLRKTIDPALTGTVELNHAVNPQSSPIFSGGLPSINQNTNTYNFSLQSGLHHRHEHAGGLQQYPHHHRQSL